MTSAGAAGVEVFTFFSGPPITAEKISTWSGIFPADADNAPRLDVEVWEPGSSITWEEHHYVYVVILEGRAGFTYEAAGCTHKVFVDPMQAIYFPPGVGIKAWCEGETPVKVVLIERHI